MLKGWSVATQDHGINGSTWKRSCKGETVHPCDLAKSRISLKLHCTQLILQWKRKRKGDSGFDILGYCIRNYMPDQQHRFQTMKQLELLRRLRT